MRADGRWARLALVGIACVFAAGCGAVTINELMADPAKYRNREVTVKGDVVESASVMGQGAYRISQGDQGLWVVTRGGAPRKGARVEVKGRLQDGYDLGSLASIIKVPESLQSGLVFVESSHKALD